MSQPVVTYSINWGNNPGLRLSGKTYTKPDGTTVDCSKTTITFSSSTHIKKFYATAVKDGRDYGFIDDVLVDIEGAHPTGVKIHELTSRNANVNFNFDIEVNKHLTAGAGTYRIGLYVQQDDGTWNYEYFFMTTESDGTHKNLQVGGTEQDPVLFQVPVITD